VKFRISGKQPELWHPVTGKICDLKNWTTKDDYTIIPLQFEASESYFIVFRHQARKSDRDSQGVINGNFMNFEPLEEINGPWKVNFQADRGAPESILMEKLVSLSENEDPGVKYFSGIASYISSFSWDGKIQNSVYLDLGKVNNLAGVTVNGKNLGIIWTAPFRIEITEALKTGENTLEIRVANTWKNRLLGDGLVDESKRVTSTYYDYKTVTQGMDKQLEPSGLIGPVRLLKGM